MTTDSSPLLEVSDLAVEFATAQGVFRAVDGVSVSIKRGQTHGIVGESGSGKSVTALSIMRLLPQSARIVGGAMQHDSRNLLSIDEKALRKLRGNRIAMIFQEPMTSLNPVFTVGAQIAEVFEIHQLLSSKQAMQRAIAMLSLVGIASPQERAHAYPHQLSGGMRQRVMIAMALALKPDLLIADEPTTALDVTIQAQIMTLIKKLQREIGMSLLLITHDLGLAAENCDEISVMYAGVIVESAPASEIFSAPSHPYTLGLLRSIPSVQHQKRLATIPGIVPHPLHLPKGCRFQDRCTFVSEICKREAPPLVEISPGHSVRCFHPVIQNGN